MQILDQTHNSYFQERIQNVFQLRTYPFQRCFFQKEIPGKFVAGSPGYTLAYCRAVPNETADCTYRCIACVVRYLKPVMGEGLVNQSLNPEVRVDKDEMYMFVDRTAMRLRQMIIKLHNAVNGHPMWFLQTDGRLSDHSCFIVSVLILRQPAHLTDK